MVLRSKEKKKRRYTNAHSHLNREMHYCELNRSVRKKKGIYDRCLFLALRGKQTKGKKKVRLEGWVKREVGKRRAISEILFLKADP